MGLKVKGDIRVTFDKIKPGEVGRIVKSPNNEYLGLLVARLLHDSRDFILAIGCVERCGNASYYWSTPYSDMIEVEILPPGTVLEITE